MYMKSGAASIEVVVFVLGQPDWDGWVEVLEELSHWVLLLVLLLNKLGIEEHLIVDGDNLLVGFCESLSETDAHASEERSPTLSESLVTAWGKTQWVRGIETLWEELERSLPLGLVEVKTVEIDLNSIICLNPKVSHLGVLSEDNIGTG